MTEVTDLEVGRSLVPGNIGTYLPGWTVKKTKKFTLLGNQIFSLFSYYNLLQKIVYSHIRGNKSSKDEI